MDYTSDQALNQKERETLEPQKSFKKQLRIANSINNVFQDLVEVLPPHKPHEMDSTVNMIGIPAKFEAEISNLDSPTFVAHSEQHCQEENIETARSNKSEYIKLQADYKSLLESYNSLSQAFRSHVSLVQSSFFLDEMKLLRAENEKLKGESHFYFEQAQKLLLENHRLKADLALTSESENSTLPPSEQRNQDFSQKSAKENSQKALNFAQELDMAREIMAKQENDIQALSYSLAQLEDLKKMHEETASMNCKLNLEIKILTENKFSLEKDMEILNEKNSILERLLGKLKIHRELLIAEKEYHQETIKELENDAQKSNLPKAYESIQGSWNKDAETLEKKYKLLEKKINEGIEIENYRLKSTDKPLKLKDSEATCREILNKLQKYQTKCQNLEKDKKLSEKNFEELKRTLCGLREELDGAEKRFKILTPNPLIKLVTLLHKSKKITFTSTAKLHSY